MDSATQEASLIHDLKQEVTKDKAFGALVKLYEKRLYWHIRKLVLVHDDANDVLQNTFIKVYKNIKGFKENASLHTWMYRIAYNESITFLTARQKQTNLSGVEFQEHLYNNLQEDIYFDGDEVQLQLQKALLELPEKQSRVFQMKYYDDLKFSEISEILGTSEGALKASYHHAVKKVKHLLTKEIVIQ